MDWVIKNKWYLVGLLLIAGVFFLGRWCAPDPEDPLVEQLQQANVKLEEQVKESDLRVDSIQLIVKEIQKHNVQLSGENEAKDRLVSSTVYKYESRIKEIKKLTEEEIDSSFVARYPGIEEPEIKKIVLSELIEGDQNREIVQIQKQQLHIKDQIISNKDEIIASLNKVITEKDLQLELRDGEITNLNASLDLKDKKIKKAKWERNGVAGIAITIIALLLL